MAFMTSLVALSIDAMLPALPKISADLKVQNSNSGQLIISFLFLGMACGQLLAGPLSDRVGRKPTVYMGLLLFICGCILSYLSTNLNIMLCGRIIQGIGLSAPRIVSMALIRDQYRGDSMARVMSFVMMVFIMVPALAPALGQLVIAWFNWRGIFALFLILTLAILFWFGLRQPETLKKESRIPFTPKNMFLAVVEVCTNRTSLGYTVCAGFVFAAFLGYLNSIQQVLQTQYHLGSLFPLYFGLLALAIGAASFFNGKLVVKAGMRKMCKTSLVILSLISILFLIHLQFNNGHPSLVMLMLYFVIILFCTGILFGNLNSLAMEPLGHIAGVGAAVVGSLSTMIALPFGIFTGRLYNGTVIPLTCGFAFFGLLCTTLMVWIEKKP